MAVEAVGECKRMGLKPKLIVRGASEDYRSQVRAAAANQGLIWATVKPTGSSMKEILEAVAERRDADILELDFFVPESFLRSLYWASQARSGEFRPRTVWNRRA